MSFIPAKSRLAVVLDAESDKTSSGLYIPQNSSERRVLSATVLAKAEDVVEFNIGDRIMLSPFHQGQEIKLEVSGKKFTVIYEKDVLGKIVK